MAVTARYHLFASNSLKARGISGEYVLSSDSLAYLHEEADKLYPGEDAWYVIIEALPDGLELVEEGGKDVRRGQLMSDDIIWEPVEP